MLSKREFEQMTAAMAGASKVDPWAGKAKIDLDYVFRLLGQYTDPVAIVTTTKLMDGTVSFDFKYRVSEDADEVQDVDAVA